MSLHNNGNPLRTMLAGVLGITANTPKGTYSSTFQLTANYL
jgi:hypothetical protein